MRYADYDWTDIIMVGIIWFLGVMATGVFALLIWAMFSPTFSLRKDEWECTASHKQYAIMMAGKVPVPTIYDECDNYKRKS